MSPITMPRSDDLHMSMVRHNRAGGEGLHLDPGAVDGLIGLTSM